MPAQTSPAQNPAPASKDEPSLRASLRDGVSAAIMLGAGETFLGPFGIFLQASIIQIGLLAAVPQLCGAIMQWVSALAMDRLRNRRTLAVATAIVQALLWLPICLLPFLFGTGAATVSLLVVLVTIYHGSSGFITPVWSSLIGDLVPASRRGHFFGQRNRLTGLATFLALLLSGGLLHLFEQGGRTAFGFLLIFSIALIARLDSARWLARHANPPLHLSPAHFFTFRQFLRRSPKSNFAKFVFFLGAINFAVAFSAPYFALYMLRDLRFSYLEFTAVSSVATVTQFLTFRYWGSLGDRFGNKKILNLCSWGISIMPTLWLVSAHIGYLLVIQVFAGFVWAGFNLASSNFIFDAVSPPKLARCVAYRGLINGACVVAGSLAGGFVASRLPTTLALGPWSWTPTFVLPVIFGCSGLLRFAATAFFLRKFREVRVVEAIRHRQLIYQVSHLKPLAGLTFSLVTGIFREPRPPRGGRLPPQAPESSPEASTD